MFGYLESHVDLKGAPMLGCDSDVRFFPYVSGDPAREVDSNCKSPIGTNPVPSTIALSGTVLG